MGVHVCVLVPRSHPSSLPMLHRILYTVNIYYSEYTWHSGWAQSVQCYNVRELEVLASILLMLNYHYILHLSSIYVIPIKWIDFSCLSSHFVLSFSCSSFSFSFIYFVSSSSSPSWCLLNAAEPKPVIELYDFLVESELQQYYNAIKWVHRYAYC